MEAVVPMLILHVEEGLLNSVKWPISAGQCHLPAALTPPPQPQQSPLLKCSMMCAHFVEMLGVVAGVTPCS